jgi:hypothetical protein
MNQLDEIFKMFFYSFCDLAKWVFAIKMASDIIKNGNNSDVEGIIKSLMNGGISYGCLYAIVEVLDSIQAKFQ